MIPLALLRYLPPSGASQAKHLRTVVIHAPLEGRSLPLELLAPNDNAGTLMPPTVYSVAGTR